MTSALAHWLQALPPVAGPQACIGLTVANCQSWPNDVAQWPAQYQERVILRFDHLDPESLALLGRLRNQHARQIAVWIDQPTEQDLNQMLALGFKTLAGPPEVACYGYDLVSYNHTRDWNNPKYWANPERWGVDHW